MTISYFNGFQVVSLPARGPVFSLELLLCLKIHLNTAGESLDNLDPAYLSYLDSPISPHHSLVCISPNSPFYALNTSALL